MINMSTLWHQFTLKELFEFNSGNQLSANKKALDINPEKDDKHTIALITQSEKNNGIIGYLEPNDEIEEKKMSNVMTYSMHFGLCFYHDYDFVLMDTHGSVFRLIPKNSYLSGVLENESVVNTFISKSITKVCGNDVYNYGWLPNSTRVAREIIMLPIEPTDDEECLVIKGKKYKLNISIIKSIISKIKTKEENKTINDFIKKKQYYDTELLKVSTEVKKTLWHQFTLKELFEFNSGNQLSANKKALDINPEKDDKHTIALITQSEKNNGIIGYLEPNDEIEEKKMSNVMTYSMHFGLCFYHDYDFVLMDTHGSVFRLIPKNSYLSGVLENESVVNTFISKSITKVCGNDVYNYGWLPNSTRVAREIIMLPIEPTDDEECLVIKGKKYKLNISIIKYLVLKGYSSYYNKLIEGYRSYIGG